MSAALAQRIAELRNAGAAKRDPARLRYIESLARRIDGQPDPVKRLLQAKLQQAVDAYAERVVQKAPALAPAAAPAPLRQLNEHIRRSNAERRGDDASEELASAQRFRLAWERGRTLDQVEQAVARKPANAGPLNSHALVLHTLAQLRELSPDYLRRFVSYAESLQWLEQAKEAQPRETAKPAKAAKAKTARARR